MRIWHGIEASSLDNRRLFAQHMEFHVIYNKIRNGKRWQGLEEPQYRSWLQYYHDSLMEEIWQRGYHSKCEFDILYPFTQKQEKYQANSTLIYQCRWTLTVRWHGEFKGRVQPEWWSDMAKRYEKYGGCTHNGPVAKLPGGKVLCMICKEWYQIDGRWYPTEYVGYLRKAEWKENK